MSMLTVGIPKEVKAGERRVALTPTGVKTLISKKVAVIVEQGAGEGSGFTDRMYQNAGAKAGCKTEEVWKQAGVIVKVKEPQAEEFGLIQKKHIVFTFLHLASEKENLLVKALLKSGAVAIGYETIHQNGHLPILRPMSEIAGTLAGYFGCYFFQKVKVRSGQIQYPASYAKDILVIEKKY
ncbi:MAG: hypothetical protein HY586_00720, partial [Candidatus Omnitrophica bacterium]|nr:hypothetical protein [Candidatus Omnitrophota bacterium]